MLADDLSGTLDTALQFREGGLRTWVAPNATKGPPVPPSVQVLATQTASRHAEAEFARRRVQEVKQWLLTQGCRSFYKAISPSLAGPIPAELAVLAHDPKWDMLAIAPAAPASGYRTLGGYQLCDSLPVNALPAEHEGHAPEAHLQSLLKGRSGLIEWNTVRKGAGAIAEHLARLRAQGIHQVVIDAVSQDDLRAIASAIHHAPFMILPVGASGLAAALSAVRNAPTLLSVTPPIPGKTPPVLVISGSPHPTSLQQIQELERSTRVIHADVRQLLLTEDEEVERLARQVLQSLLAGRDVVLATAASSEQRQRDLKLGAELGLSGDQFARHLASLMGKLVRRIVQHEPVENLLINGSETVEAVLAELPGERLELLGAAMPATPLLWLVGTRMRVVTKAGASGHANALVEIVSFLRTSGLTDEAPPPGEGQNLWNG